MYYLEIFSLDGCPYSKAANDLLLKHKINLNLINISYENRDKFKNEKINTFPQIFLKKRNRSSGLLVGGFDELNEATFIIENNLSNDELSDTKNLLKNVFVEDFSDRAILRFIQLFMK